VLDRLLTRRCRACDKPLVAGRRADTLFCSDACRKRLSRRQAAAPPPEERTPPPPARTPVRGLRDISDPSWTTVAPWREGTTP